MPDDLHICPAPDCDFSTRDISELAAHVNTEHAGEYKRPNWPDFDEV